MPIISYDVNQTVNYQIRKRASRDSSFCYTGKMFINSK